MDDYQVILYIIFGIIYFIFNLLKKKDEPVTREEQPEEMEGDAPGPRQREVGAGPFDETVGQPQAKKRRPATFEELLEDFERAAGKADRKADEKVKKVQEVDDEYRPATEEADTRYSEQEAEKRIRETEARKVLQEKASAAKRAEAIGKEVNQKLSEASKTIDMEAKQERRPDARSKENRRREEMLKMLQNPESVANAIIASEVLQRKYF